MAEGGAGEFSDDGSTPHQLGLFGGAAGAASSPRVLIARGARAAESLLVGAVAEDGAAVRAQPHRLAAPLRIVVPSRSLREHVARELVRSQGGAVAGVAVQTLRGLALEVLHRAGAGAPGGDLLLGLVVRRASRAEHELSRVLGELADGYGVVALSVTDLLDAGLDETTAEPALAAAETLPEPLRGRVEALCRVALGCRAALAGLGLEHRSDLFRRAADALAGEPGLLPARRVLLHGWADATGTASDLLGALVQGCRATAIIDQPDDPAQPGSPDAGRGFAQRLIERLSGAAVPADAGGPPPSVELGLVAAPGIEAEVREAAETAARLVHDEGLEPESIAIVVRDLGDYEAPLRTHLGRLGVPFSGAPGAVGPACPDAWPVRALLGLLRTRDACSCDRWLDACDFLPPLHERDVRLALHALGIARLGDATELPDPVCSDASFALPVRSGLSSRVDGGPEAGRARRRRVPGERLADVRERARAILRELATLASRTARLEDWIARLRRIVFDALGWQRDRTAGASGFLDALDRLAADLPGDFSLDLDEFVLLLERATRGLGHEPLGGAGSGVAVLDATEARARTFSRLLLLGLERGRFPRAFSEDALLPEAAREALQAVLPDVPLHWRRFDEERHLFAELCSSAPHVILSYPDLSDDGKERAPSPLVERIRLARSDLARPRRAPPVYEDRAGALVPPFERALRAARQRRLSADAMQGALETAPWPLTQVPARVADVRVRIVNELDPPLGGPRGLGPYFGMLGADPQPGSLYVTHLEAISRCGWQALIERSLRISPLPDARVALPSIGPRVVGNALHLVLHAIVDGDAAFDRASSAGFEPTAPGRTVPWPEAPRLEQWLARACRTVLQDEGVSLAGFERVLANRVRPLIERVRDQDFASGRCEGVVGAELGFEVQPEGAGGRGLRFRADRVDRIGGRLVLTDYKSGRPVYGDTTKPETRASRALEKLARGEWLQAASYASSSEGAVGRYLFARPDLGPLPSESRATLADPATHAAFQRSLATLVAQAAAGAFLPRLVDEGGAVPRTCGQWCEVRDACSQGDTIARHRLRRWAEAVREVAPADGRERAARDGFWLGRGSDSGGDRAGHDEEDRA